MINPHPINPAEILVRRQAHRVAAMRVLSPGPLLLAIVEASQGPIAPVAATNWQLDRLPRQSAIRQALVQGATAVLVEAQQEAQAALQAVAHVNSNSKDKPRP